MQKHRLLQQALPSLFPFSLPLPLPFLHPPRRLSRTRILALSSLLQTDLNTGLVPSVAQGRGGMMLSKYRDLISAFNTKLSIQYHKLISRVAAYNTISRFPLYFYILFFSGACSLPVREGGGGEATILRKLRRFPKYSVF